MKKLWIAVLVVFATCSSGNVVVFADCKSKGQSCKINDDCCSKVCKSGGCRDAATPTTVVPPSTVTSSTVTSSTTSTTLQASLPVTFVRYDPIHLGRRFPDSQDIEFDPRTGRSANQYTRYIRMGNAWWVIEPEILRTLRDNQCPQLDTASGIFSVVAGKFFIHYSVKDMPQPYRFHANYLMDNHQGNLDRLAQCKAASLSQTMRDVLATDPPKPSDVKPTSDEQKQEDWGAFDPKHVFKPLTKEQGEAARYVHDLHMQHVAALLAHDQAAADAIAVKIRPAHERLTKLARDPYESALFDIQFTGYIDIVPGDRFCTQERADYWTKITDDDHMCWLDALKIGTGLPPDAVQAWICGNLEHARSHAMRAACIEGMALRHAYDRTRTVPKCTLNRRFDPKLGYWVDAGVEYDNHACPVDDK